MLTVEERRVPEDLAAILDPWIKWQRWFPGEESWSSSTCVELDHGVQVWLLRTATGAVFNVPIVLETDPFAVRAILAKPAARAAVIGYLDAGNPTANNPAPRRIAVIDAPFSPKFIEAMMFDTQCKGSSANAIVLAGEQSNTSVLLPTAGVIWKVLRTVTDGIHPDADVPRRLAATGFDRVPKVLAQWTVTVDDGQFLGGWQGTLAVASQLVNNAEDGFTLAAAMAAGAISFAEHAELLGEQTAALHRALAIAYPTEHTEAVQILDGITIRIESIAERSDRVRDLMGPIDSFLARIRHEIGGAQLTMQRLHGDMHLGQTLWDGVGWNFIDFEGEPLRSLTERIRPGLPEQDLAGLLRSIGYAAAMAESPDSDWEVAARDALITGYLKGAFKADAEPRSLVEVLVNAYELDKTIYEVAYEEQHRPDWVNIPLSALNRQLEEFI